MPASNIDGSVLVLGGGISGIQAALDLADAGFYVHLVEKSGAIGGAMPQFDKTFPTNDCSMCIISPKLVECGRHPNVNLLTLTEVEDIQGQEGNYQIRLRQSPRYVDPGRCIACGQCVRVCPQEVEDVQSSSMRRRAIYVKFPQAVPLKYQIDPQACIRLNKPGRCGACADICPPQAVNFDDRGHEFNLTVGAIILAPGFRPFDPSASQIYGYGLYPNVITSLQFERYSAATGPTGGELLRPSDGKPARRIAFVQCVGSRDKNTCKNEYCSAVCCMYTIKQAVIAKDSTPGLEASIFYLDMRTPGKDFDRYYTSARNESGVRFLRSRIYGVEPEGKNGDLRLHYINDDGRQVEERFDMVVLAVGLEAPPDMVELAGRIGLHLTPDRFASVSAFMPVLTSKKGIFTCGVFAGPRDIPMSVTAGSAAAAGASQLLAEARGSKTVQPRYPRQQATGDQEPRIGVLVCHCGTNIAGVIDVSAVADFAATLPGVCHVERNLFTCSQDTQTHMVELIQDKRLNRIVVAACTPRTHEPLFQETLKTVGLNPYLFEMANIRNQDSWVHNHAPEAATDKAKDLVRIAVAKVRRKVELQEISVPIIQEALVIGGGLAGMTSALSIAEQGFKVHLVEKTEQLGGNAQHLYQTWNGEHVPLHLKNITSRVTTHPNIRLYLDSTVEPSTGYLGNCQTKLKNSQGEQQVVRHGVGIIAIGAKRLIPEEFGYGKISNVVAAIEFDKLHIHNESRITRSKTFVFIQCVGSRNETRPYCSKVCCTHSVQSAIKLKKEDPARQIYILYRDIRTYGQRERLYNQARELGIIFINYELHGQPTVLEQDAHLIVEVWDHILHRPLEIRTDLVILAAAILPNPDGQHLVETFKLSLDGDGFFQEAHAKLRPVELMAEGMFVAGLAQYPKPIEESVSQALAVAAKAAGLLSRREIRQDAIKAVVDPVHCDGCALCIDVCPYKAITLIEGSGPDEEEHKLVEINQALCKGCGICMGTCPKRGVDVAGFTFDQITAQIDAALHDRCGQESD